MRFYSVWLAATIVSTIAGCSREVVRPDTADPVRPRIAHVVDADTGKPVPGATVLNAFYTRPKRGFLNFPISKVFIGSAEAATDSQGRFTVSGPFNSSSWWNDELYIFKAGYGPWRFRGRTERVKGPETEAAWERFTTIGEVIELRPLRTRAERVKYVDGGWAPEDVREPGFHRETPYDPLYFFDIPQERLISLQQAVDSERRSLGLPPKPLDGRRQRR